MVAEVHTDPAFIPGVVNVADNTTTVRTGACIVRGICVNTVLSNHALPIKNGSTTIFTLPASAAAGTFFNLWDTYFDTSLIVDPDDAATGSITVVYKPIN